MSRSTELDRSKCISVSVRENIDNHIVAWSYTDPPTNELPIFLYTPEQTKTQWDKAMEAITVFARNAQRLQLTIYGMPTYPRHLPTSIDLRSIRSISFLNVTWYPGLKSIDVSTLRYLTYLRISVAQYLRLHPPILNIPRLTDIHVIGVFNCIYLEELHVLNGSEQPYRLKIGARVCNLQALEILKIAETCVNERVPFEFGASVSLKRIESDSERIRYPVDWNTAPFARARQYRFYWKLAKAVCITLKHASVLRDRPIVKLWARGPMHHPSVIYDIVRCFLNREY